MRACSLQSSGAGSFHLILSLPDDDPTSCPPSGLMPPHRDRCNPADNELHGPVPYDARSDAWCRTLAFTQLGSTRNPRTQHRPPKSLVLILAIDPALKELTVTQEAHGMCCVSAPPSYGGLRVNVTEPSLRFPALCDDTCFSMLRPARKHGSNVSRLEIRITSVRQSQPTSRRVAEERKIRYACVPGLAVRTRSKDSGATSSAEPELQMQTSGCHF